MVQLVAGKSNMFTSGMRNLYILLLCICTKKQPLRVVFYFLENIFYL